MAILERMLGSGAQARAVVAGTAWPGASPAVGATAARPTPPGATVRIGNVLYTASMLLQQFSRMRERDQVHAALARFHLDRSQAAHILSAYAYVWARNMAPLIPRFFWKLPYAGDRRGVNERFAQALGRYERDNPGTVFLATQGNAAAQRAVEIVLDQSLAGGIVNRPIEVFERTSSVDRALSTSSTSARRLLGIETNRSWVAHHLIPFSTVAALPVDVQRAIVAAKWRMDSVENLVALPANEATYEGAPNDTIYPMHGGGHPRYNAAVSLALSPLIASGARLDPLQLNAFMLNVAHQFRRNLVMQRLIWHVRVG